MIINNNQEEIKNVGFEASTQMGIKDKNLHKIFKLLTTSSYKDSEGSILREYLVNGIDSQVSVGKINDPIYLTYIQDANSISMKDNGLGMSEEFIRNVYMSLGDSTKENDANQIGAFGIGSKSVFSYTTYYYLTSRYNGEIKEYLVSESETGLPDVSLLSVNPTEESNGVEIKFDLKSTNDYVKFKKAAENQLKYFKNIIIEGFDIDNNYKIIRGSHFSYRPDRVNITRQLELIWENVIFPIDFVFLEIFPININCALYFPQETPFQPEAARENLRHTENNKKLILDKIKLAETELYELWKEQQIIFSFFDYRKTDRKVIKFDEHQLDVTDIISEEYIFEPLVDTHINNKKFKNQLWDLFPKFFNYRKNTRWYSNSWEQIKTCDKIYHTKNSANVSNGKLSKANWKGVIIEKENLNYYDIVSKIYDTSVCEIKIVDGERVVISNIDWKSEIDYVISCIWKEIVDNTIDIHSLTFKTERNRNVIDNTQVRGKFSYSAYTQNTWEIKQLSFIKQFRYVVVTTDPIEYDKLLQFKFEPTTRKKGVTTKVDRYFCAILTSKKYLKRLEWCYSYEDFLKTNLMEKYFYKFQHYKLRDNYKVNLDELRKWVNIHPTYQNKFSYYKEFFKKKDYKYIPNRIEEDLLKIYSIDNITNEYNTIRDKVLKLLSYGNSSGEIKYKMLFNYTKQKLNKQKCIQ